jgi:AcrR family transcriptional regulator
MPRVTGKTAVRKAKSPAAAERASRGSHAERREEAEAGMIVAAIRIVSERGLEGLTLAECGEAAGYSRGLAAHYFKSKDGLLVAIANRIVVRYVEQLRASRPSDGRGLEAILRSAAYYIDSSRRNLVNLRAFQAVIASAINASVVSEEVAKLNRASLEGFAAGIRWGIAHGEIRKEIDPIAGAALIVSGVRGVMSLWLVDPKSIDLDVITYELVDNLRRYFAS